MIIGTAGHIDHGKTSLIRALTGVDTDRLPQEKQRGITIELGFAYQTLQNGRRIGFVDVPGHEKLIHTMLTGAGSIDYVMLVVAADDGVMPQTREHLDILQLLGIKNGLVVITRTDLVGVEQVTQCENQIRQFLHGTFLENAPIFAVSSLTGEGMDALRQQITTVSAEFPVRQPQGYFRHAIDRCFSVAGAGTIVTGIVLSGSCTIKDTLLIAPNNIKARLRNIHVQDEAATIAHQGDRAAMNLTGEQVSKEAIKRGMMVVDPFLNHPTIRFDASITFLPNARKANQQWFPVRLHHGAQDMNAHLVFLEGDGMQAGETAFAQIVSEKPLVAVNGDRFILRDTTASFTVGGGVIIDPQAPSRRRRSRERLTYLKAMVHHDHLLALHDLLQQPPYGVDWESFCRARNIDLQMAKSLLSQNGVSTLKHGQDLFVIATEQITKLLQTILKYLADFHESDPDLFGVGLEKLRRDVAPDIKAPLFRELLQDEITKGQLKIRGAWIGLASHEAKLSNEDEKLWQKIEPFLYGDERFRPPRTRDFAHSLGIDEQHMRDILKSLSRMGKLYEVAQDYFFPREVLDEIIHIMSALADVQPKHEFIAADLRDKLDNGRKVAILMLEFFDRHGVTIRRGDIRRLNPHRLNLFASS